MKKKATKRTAAKKSSAAKPARAKSAKKASRKTAKKAAKKKVAKKKVGKKKVAKKRPAAKKAAKKTTRKKASTSSRSAARKSSAKKVAKKKTAKKAKKKASTKKTSKAQAAKPVKKTTVRVARKTPWPAATIVVSATPKRKTRAISKTQMAKLEKVLDAKRLELLDTIALEERGGFQAPEDGIEDLVDRANTAYSRELSFAISDGERILLEQIEDATERLGNGTFGGCVHCERQIPMARLQALPWARYCIDCQELKERGLLAD